MRLPANRGQASNHKTTAVTKPVPAAPELLVPFSLVTAETCHELLEILHRPADFRRRAVGADLRCGAFVSSGASDLRISGSHPADRGRSRAISRRKSEGDRRVRRHTDRGTDQRRREHALHEQPGHRRRPDDLERHVSPGHRSGQGAAACAEPRVPGRAAPARSDPPARHHDREKLARHDAGRAPAVAERPLRHDVSAQLRRAERQGPARAHSGRGAGGDLGRRRLFDAHLARPAKGRRARPVAGRHRAGDQGSERRSRSGNDRRVTEPA